ncbi:MAG: efflux RND transporter periplasmic adaptor subunit [Prevotellaceae bacterium]|jgi:HlyD family secretion protein|nr:efflux RND transporter periplasmic adaptor subunit [Prevotellaceae bacterium]
MKTGIFLIMAAFCFAACKSRAPLHDASGVFEATEVTVSAEASGKLERFDLREGDRIEKGRCLGHVDSIQLHLTKLQLMAARNAVESKKPDVGLQIAAIGEQVSKAEMEKKRAENLFRDGVATRKQLDDAVSQLSVLRKTLDAQTSSLKLSVKSLDEESVSLAVQIARIDDQIARCRVTNPIDGVALSKYAEEKETVTQGRPLYKIADIDNMFLRVYVVSSQLRDVALGQRAEVTVSFGETIKRYDGAVTWISSKAEFTPKTVQTKDERENLVYAVKIALRNSDGLLKIGMYGDARFNPANGERDGLSFRDGSFRDALTGDER